MKNGLKVDQLKPKIELFISQLYLDTHGPSAAQTSAGSKLTEEYIIRLVTRLAVSIASAWWSLMELLDYFRNRRMVRDLSNGTLS